MYRYFVLAALLIASTARATTYVVGTDAELIRSSTAIVVATAGESISFRSARGTIETATRMHVEEAIAGPFQAGDEFDVVELGGIVGDTGLAIAGAPRFQPGERSLLMLGVDGDGAWTTVGMGLGQFALRRDLDGREYLERGEVFGWNTDGTPHRELHRSAPEFLQFVRETVRGRHARDDYFAPRAQSIETNAVGPASTYVLQQGGTGMRWNTFPAQVVFRSNGSQPGTTDGGLGAAQRGIAVWSSNASSNIAYTLAGTTGTNGLSQSDGINSIVFNDPANFIGGAFPGSGDSRNVLAVGGAWFDPGRTHTFNGETFLTIQEADLVVQNGINTGGGAAGLTGRGFDHVLAHELGHTLGFRHSDQNPDGSSPCTQPSCTSTALMNSTVDFNNDPLGAALLPWDVEAASAVYGAGAGPPPCTPPSITAQPQSADFRGSPVALTVVASGTAPLSYQWFAGTRGDTRQPAANGTGPVLTVDTLTQTTSYWVRVTGQCSPPADSDTATITVNGCPGVTITSISQGTTIIQGRSETVSVSASSPGRNLTFQWFAGSRGDTSRPVSGGTSPSLTVTPAVTQSYWVQVSNDCGAVGTSEAVTITVIPCTAPRVVIAPANAQAIAGTGATLSATISGTQPVVFQWFEGTRGDTSHPVPNATTSSFTTQPLFSPSSFWLQASNACGTISTDVAAVTIVQTCTAPSINVQPQNQTVPAGTSAILTVDASGPSLTYAWYQGTVLDFTHPVGGSGPAMATPPITAPTQFWVRVTNPCGRSDSAAVTVSPGTAKRRAVRR